MAEPAMEEKQINVKIKRFNPEKDKRPYWAEYKLKARGTDRVLDVLNQIKWETDGTLSYRRSCAHGICGLGRDADQRCQPARVQDSGPRFR